MTLRKYVWEDLRVTLQLWKDSRALLGIVILLLAAFGFGAYMDDPVVVKWSTYFAVACLLTMFVGVAPFKMWSKAQRHIEALEEALKPQLCLAFEQEKLPYVQEQRIWPADDGQFSYVDRRFRVGIRNDSSRVISNVRVVLES